MQHLASDASALELIAQLKALEDCGTSSLVTTSTADGSPGSSAGNDAQTADVRAAGCIAVQLFRRKRLLLSSSRWAAWDAEVMLSAHQDEGTLKLLFPEWHCAEYPTDPCCSHGRCSTSHCICRLL